MILCYTEDCEMRDCIQCPKYGKKRAEAYKQKPISKEDANHPESIVEPDKQEEIKFE